MHMIDPGEPVDSSALGLVFPEMSGRHPVGVTRRRKRSAMSVYRTAEPLRVHGRLSIFLAIQIVVRANGLSEIY